MPTFVERNFFVNFKLFQTIFIFSHVSIRKCSMLHYSLQLWTKGPKIKLHRKNLYSYMEDSVLLPIISLIERFACPNKKKFSLTCISFFTLILCVYEHPNLIYYYCIADKMSLLLQKLLFTKQIMYDIVIFYTILQHDQV